MTALDKLESLEEFLFGTPLYKEYELPDDLKLAEKLYGRSRQHPLRIDGHCPYCGKASTFTVSGAHCLDNRWPDIKQRYAFDNLELECVRNASHEIRYTFRIRRMAIQKVGQFPSLADISNDEVGQYRKGMNSVDANEFHKAIGLAAHGVGIGSFVYFRRIFERLIYNRYNEFKVAEGWTDEEFNKLRMNEKVRHLSSHLPTFLVENAKIYSILSNGIHELDEETCLGYFDLMKRSIMIILDEDKTKMEALAAKEEFAKAISAFTTSAETKPTETEN